MATVGIVGGLGPESTVDYYRRILLAWHRAAYASPYASIAGVPVLDTTGLHVAAIVQRLRGHHTE